MCRYLTTSKHRQQQNPWVEQTNYTTPIVLMLFAKRVEQQSIIAVHFVNVKHK